MTVPVLDWAPSQDPRNAAYPVRASLRPADGAPTRARMWDTGPVLDQGDIGACVGFGWTAELLASPRPDRYATTADGNTYARSLYSDALDVDEWPGRDYEGTSVNAGAKVVRARGLIAGWQWATTELDVRDAVTQLGPVVIGVWWRDGMFRPRPSGLLDIGGAKVGGHCLTITGYHPRMRLASEGWRTRFEVYRLRNSWGIGWGHRGDCYLRATDLAALLDDDGEAAVPIGRARVRIPVTA